MNTPNILTTIRIFLSPIFLIVLMSASIPHNYAIALLLFVVASITDLLDGMLARKNNQITNFGKFLDPIADKMLTTAALLGLMQMGLCNIWILMLVLTREFIVTSVRLVASSGGKVIAASLWGKLKTVSQMVSIIVILLMLELNLIGLLPDSFPLDIVSSVLLWISTAFTLISGIQYVWNYKDYITPEK